MASNLLKKCQVSLSSLWPHASPQREPMEDLLGRRRRVCAPHVSVRAGGRGTAVSKDMESQFGQLHCYSGIIKTTVTSHPCLNPNVCQEEETSPCGR